MIKRHYLWLILSVLFALISGACAAELYGPQQPAVGMQTAVNQTVEAIQTQAMFNTLVAQVTQHAMATLTFTASPLPSQTATDIFTATATPSFTPSNTPLPPTNTPKPTKTPVPPTATEPPLPCLKIGRIRDITIPDGTELTAERSFTKTWRLYNGGRCTWNKNFDVYFVSGNAMSAPANIDIDDTVRPGEYTDVSVEMIAPDSTGKHTGYWKMRSDEGVSFGWGAEANKSFWIEIMVNKPLPTHDPSKVVNFITQACSADWRSSKGKVSCPSSKDNFVSGSVRISSSSKLEGGYQEDEKALIVVPSDGSDGVISGKYPAFKVKDGDQFTAIIGCLDSSPDCSVRFQVNYVIGDGSVNNLKSWNQYYDGEFNRVTVDLSPLAGKTVNLILTVLNKDGSSDDDRAFWLAPVIQR